MTSDCDYYYEFSGSESSCFQLPAEYSCFLTFDGKVQCNGSEVYASLLFESELTLSRMHLRFNKNNIVAALRSFGMSLGLVKPVTSFTDYFMCKEKVEHRL